MITDYHSAPWLKLNINPARGVGQKERLDTEQLKCADREVTSSIEYPSNSARGPHSQNRT